MKVTITRTKIDTAPLMDALYGDRLRGKKAYLMMSKDTFNAFHDECTLEFERGDKHLMYNFAIYQGNNIYIDNDLPFGTVDIR